MDSILKNRQIKAINQIKPVRVGFRIRFITKSIFKMKSKLLY